ncbi:hypothetical protein RND71_014610 [Anisodus tanguticus]|uniref:Uncharacterized protein n=1 Tax=Anisodus tanguticus TaxID=243964 RepID=A0AAE1VNT5_9SOLA|nr:hypothetical protein RND71_014610 [Anisodus tanguticus]
MQYKRNHRRHRSRIGMWWLQTRHRRKKEWPEVYGWHQNSIRDETLWLWESVNPIEYPFKSVGSRRVRANALVTKQEQCWALWSLTGTNEEEHSSGRVVFLPIWRRYQHFSLIWERSRESRAYRPAIVTSLFIVATVVIVNKVETSRKKLRIGRAILPVNWSQKQAE